MRERYERQVCAVRCQGEEGICTERPEDAREVRCQESDGGRDLGYGGQESEGGFDRRGEVEDSWRTRNSIAPSVRSPCSIPWCAGIAARSFAACAARRWKASTTWGLGRDR